MNTIDELVAFCEEPQPVGALLLTGEWGCGKTYLIENTLSDKMKDTHIFIRVSLFGVTSAESIIERVNAQWFHAWISQNENLEKIDSVFSKIQNKVKKLPLPESWKNIAAIDTATFFEEKSKIGNKIVVLVFDDLERTKLDTIDVLGCINEYCENKEFHTIIVANEEKIMKQCSFDVENSKQRNENENNDKVVAITSNEKKKIQYAEIKEKIIQRTVRYKPDYQSIVKQIISDMRYQGGDDYKGFLQSCEKDILNAFAPEGESDRETECPHNIRSLKCALQDFYRIYQLIKKHSLGDGNRWLCSFIIYVLANKANIAREGHYGALFINEEINRYYPTFDERYIFSSVENWILRGEWDEKAVEEEIHVYINRKKAKTPIELLQCCSVVALEEDTIAQGFDGVLKKAYEGSLTIDEYVIFIENSCYARRYEYQFPEEINWDKVQVGLRVMIDRLKNERVEDSHYRHVITQENRSLFTKEEWETYTVISDFWENRELTYSNNKKLYCESLINYGCAGFRIFQNRMYDLFDEEMAQETYTAFEKSQNSEKYYFPDYFEKMWINVDKCHQFKLVESVAGFKKLRSQLCGLVTFYEATRKPFAKKHTEAFVETVDKIIEKCLLKSASEEIGCAQEDDN